MKLFVLLLAVGLSTAVAEEAQVDWERIYDSGKRDDVCDVALDASGNIFVAGTTSDEGINSDFLILKYDKYGALVWDTTYDSGDEDYAYGVAADPEGNVFVSGYSLVDTDQDFRLVKLDSAGNLLWARTYNLGYDRAAKVATDASGAAYVAGYSIVGSDGRFLTVKFSKDGTSLWSKDYGANADDHAMNICTDASGNVYVAGYSRIGSSAFDMLVIKYSSQGSEMLNETYDSGASEYATGIAVDTGGHIYLTGYVPGSDFLTVACDPGLSDIWSSLYTTGNEARDIAVDDGCNVYVVGELKGGSYDFVTIKYSVLGTLRWEAHASHYAPRGLSAIALDPDRNVYVVGPHDNGTDVDFVLIKYRQVSGVTEQGSAPSFPSLALLTSHASIATLAYSLARNEHAILSFYSCNGALLSPPVLLSAAQGTYTWDARSLPPGVYFARLNSSQGSKTVKVVVAN